MGYISNACSVYHPAGYLMGFRGGGLLFQDATMEQGLGGLWIHIGDWGHTHRPESTMPLAPFGRERS